MISPTFIEALDARLAQIREVIIEHIKDIDDHENHDPDFLIHSALEVLQQEEDEVVVEQPRIEVNPVNERMLVALEKVEAAISMRTSAREFHEMLVAVREALAEARRS